MATVVGLIGACAGIATVAVQVTHSIDQLIQDLENAPVVLYTLRSQLHGFSSTIQNINIALEASHAPSSTINTHAHQLRDAADGGAVIIRELQLQLAEVRSDMPMRQPNGTTLQLSLKERVAFKWSENQIMKWSNALSAHCGVMSLLLQSQELFRNGFVDCVVDDELSDTSSRGSLEQQKLLANQDALAAEWTDIGENILADTPEEGVPHQDRQSPDPASQSPAKRTVEKQAVSGGLMSFFRRKTEPVAPVEKVELPRDHPVDSAVELAERYRDLLSSQSQKVSLNHYKFRALLLGQPGVGKTTLCSRVLGIQINESELLHGDPTHAEEIWKPVTFSGVNERLILHDSAGFTAGKRGRKTIEEAKSFIESTRTRSLADQIHCIWYLIDCDRERPVQDIDEEFFAGELIDTGEIPVFLVFTKYDKLRDTIRQRAGSDASDEEVENKTFEYFKTKIEAKITDSIKDKSKISICRVGLGPRGEYLPEAFKDGEAIGCDALVRQMSAQLDGGYLQLLWIATQQNDDHSKLLQSTAASIGLFWSTRKVTKLSYLPYMCFLGVASTYMSTLTIAASNWQLYCLPDIEGEILRSIFNINRLDLFASACLLMNNIVGSWSLPLISEITLKIVVGVNLIARRVFLRQNELGRRITTEEAQEEVQKFRKSEDRKRLAASISSTRLAQIDYKQEERKDEVMEVAKEAIEAAVGYVDESFFTAERLKVLKQLASAEGLVGRPL